jgi:hypothetical protein
MAQTPHVCLLHQESHRQLDERYRQEQSRVPGVRCQDKDAHLSSLLLQNHTRDTARELSIYNWGFLKQGRWNRGIFKRFRNDYMWGFLSGTGKCLEMRCLPEGAEDIQEGEAWYIGDLGWCKAVPPIRRWTNYKEFQREAKKDQTLLSRLGFIDFQDVDRFLKENKYDQEIKAGRVWTFGIRTVGFAECVPCASSMPR